MAHFIDPAVQYSDDDPRQTGRLAPIETPEESPYRLGGATQAFEGVTVDNPLWDRVKDSPRVQAGISAGTAGSDEGRDLAETATGADLTTPAEAGGQAVADTAGQILSDVPSVPDVPSGGDIRGLVVLLGAFALALVGLNAFARGAGQGVAS